MINTVTMEEFIKELLEEALQRGIFVNDPAIAIASFFNYLIVDAFRIRKVDDYDFANAIEKIYDLHDLFNKMIIEEILGEK